MHGDFRLLAGGTKAVADEIDFGLHHGKIVLGSPLQNKPRTQRGKIGDAGDIQEDVLWKHGGEARQDLLGLPPLSLEVHDIGLHKNSTAVTENGHGLGGKGKVSELINVESETLCSGL